MVPETEGVLRSYADSHQMMHGLLPVAHTRTLTDGPVALRPSWISHKKPAVLLSCQTATSAFPLTSVAMLFAPARRVTAGKMIQTT